MAFEPEVVNTHLIAVEIRKWRKIWEAEYPPSLHEFMGAWNWLSQKTGVQERRLRAIANEGPPSIVTKNVSLGTADAILTAIGRHHLLGHEIPVIPNPRWSQERWLEYMASRGCV